MSEVKRRTIFYEMVKGTVNFLDWAVVTLGNSDSGLSRMVEPFMVNQRYLTSTGIREYDPTDPAHRIDFMQRIDPNNLPRILSGVDKGETPLHGGTLTPQIGRGDLVSP